MFLSRVSKQILNILFFNVHRKANSAWHRKMYNKSYWYFPTQVLLCLKSDFSYLVFAMSNMDFSCCLFIKLGTIYFYIYINLYIYVYINFNRTAEQMYGIDKRKSWKWQKNGKKIANLMGIKQAKLRSRLYLTKPLSVNLVKRIIAFSQSECYWISCTIMKKEQLKAKTTLKTWIFLLNQILRAVAEKRRSNHLIFLF